MNYQDLATLRLINKQFCQGTNLAILNVLSQPKEQNQDLAFLNEISAQKLEDYTEPTNIQESLCELNSKYNNVRNVHIKERQRR